VPDPSMLIDNPGTITISSKMNYMQGDEEDNGYPPFNPPKGPAPF